MLKAPPTDSAKWTRMWRRVHADPQPDNAPVDLTKRGVFPKVKRRPDGTFEILVLPKR